MLLEGTQNFLYNQVDRDGVRALNVEGERGKIVIRPWDERMQEDEVCTPLLSRFVASLAS